jgi:hypothetical protein
MANSVSQVVDIASPGITRRSVDLLPAIFRTDKNAKFLAGTLDQLIQPAQLERLSGWVGSKNTPTYNPSKDNYIPTNTKLRQAYQVEPALIVSDDNLNVKNALSYDDLINQLSYEGSNVKDLSRLFAPEFYSYNPHICWDKFVNFDQYYWMPFGPDVVSITGESNDTTSTYTVSDTRDGNYFVFTPDGLTPIPNITLYRGITYVFNIQSDKKFWIKSTRVAGTDAPYRNVENNGVSNGKLIFKVDENTPERLFYVAEDSEFNGGEILVKSQVEDSAIDVNQIIGKASYTSGNGVKLTNGLRIQFAGNVFPEEYEGKEFYVEGVGQAIRLIDVASLETPENYVESLDDDFDASSFDDYPFDTFTTTPINPEYITINRASLDRNPWTRYNRWFHEDVVITSAELNGRAPVLPVENRAKRPIVEFEADLQLFNFGAVAVKNVQHIDTTTNDAFSYIEGQLGYYVDGVELANGDRIIFTADKDPFVNSKIWTVNFVTIEGEFKIALEEAEDSPPRTGDAVVITKGTYTIGTNWWFNGSVWIEAQQKTALNQFPLFEVYDNSGHRYADKTYYDSDFGGTKLFNYAVGTGTEDAVLGFSLKYKNLADQAFYLFENYFMSDLARVINFNVTYYVPVSTGFLKKNHSIDEFEYVNVWQETQPYTVPVIQSTVTEQVTDSIEITAIDNPGYQTFDLTVIVNSQKLYEGVDYRLYTDRARKGVVFYTPVAKNTHVVFKLYTDAFPTKGAFEVSPGWTNNPLNGPISEFTLSELTDHAETMAEKHPDFEGPFLGKNNSRDIINLSSYGSRLIRNKNPLAFAGYFIVNNEMNIIESMRTVAQDYNVFKLNFLNYATDLKGVYEPSKAIDIIMNNINLTKDVVSPYYYTDMMAYGTDVVSRDFKVTDPRNKEYGLDNIYKLSFDNPRAVYVYHTSKSTGIKTHLIYERDYEFDIVESTVRILIDISTGDTITVSDYRSSDGCFIPPTPTKLGLYPKFVPQIYTDTTYVEPQQVIQGHDGSIMIAFGDYRDELILELEKRIFNNLKVNYNPDLFDFNSVVPSRFRETQYGRAQINNILRPEFLRWNSFYGFDYEKNSTVTDSSKSWNFVTAKDPSSFIPMLGNHRGIWKFYLDTDRPHSHPWEMLGFSVMPSWWESEYGPAPYTRGNEVLWDDLEEGLIRDPAGRQVNPKYRRPGLTNWIPVDDNGNLLDPASAGLAQNLNPNEVSKNWEFGDQGPTETAWRRSSYYPYAMQIMATLTAPASYSSLLFDTARIAKNSAGQFVNTVTNDFLKIADLLLYTDTLAGDLIRAAGYSVILIEAGKQKNKSYITALKSDISNISMKLLHKVGGFVSQDKLEITVDSVSPSSSNPGVTLSNEDYELFLDQSNPILTIGVSGIIVQKTAEGYVLRGYDKLQPFFNCYMPVSTAKDPTITVGGKSESYVNWQASIATGTGLSNSELTTAVSSNTGYKFYKAGQIVKYQEKFYRVSVSHQGSSAFLIKYHQQLPNLPKVGGTTVTKPVKYSKELTFIPYGKTFSTAQEVFDVIMGYGHWLESAGLIFDEYNADFFEVLNWQFTGKEFLYWASQGWTTNSVITLSPFANTLKYKNMTAMVDDLGSAFYEYSVLKADGLPLKEVNLNVTRQDGIVTIKSVNTADGIYFIRLNCVQKEHSLIFNNYSLFNDVIYDVESGYSQKRLKLNGLRTAKWNGDLYSPGFVYDEAHITDWQRYTNYSPGDVVRFSGNYYSAIRPIAGASEINLSEWRVLGSRPAAQLLPNFDYKIDQFRDFYSLDIDNFDINQQKLAQHLIGYTDRPYLDNVFVNPISQYKFYQGFIKEKGTKNTISKLTKASSQTLGSSIDYYEEWGFRVGEFGSFPTDQSLEINLDETQFKENPQIVKFVDDILTIRPNETYIYQIPENIVIKPDGYVSMPFITTSSNYEDVFKLPVAGYPRLDDVSITAFNKPAILDIANSRLLNDGDTVWVGFTENNDWNVYRHTKLNVSVVDAEILIPAQQILITTDERHELKVGDLINVTQFDSQVNGTYQVNMIESKTKFRVSSTLEEIQTPFSPALGLLFKFIPVRFENADDVINFSLMSRMNPGENLWIDNDGNNHWIVIQRQDPYQHSSYTPDVIENIDNQQFGYKIVSNEAGNKFIVSAPSYDIGDSIKGRIYAYRKNSTGTNSIINVSKLLLNIGANSTYYTTTADPKYGASLAFDEKHEIVIAGAPNAGNVKYNTPVAKKFAEVTTNATTSSGNNQGLVKWSKISFDNAELVTQATFASPYPQIGAYFGKEIHYHTLAGKEFLYVAAPGQDSNQGAVFYNAYGVTSTDVTLTLNTYTSLQNSLTVSLSTLEPGDLFGSSIAGSGYRQKVAVSAPGTNGGAGAVYVFNYTNGITFTNTQVITSYDLGLYNTDTRFSEKILMDKTGDYLFIGAPGSTDVDNKIGKVLVLKLQGNEYQYLQTLTSPYEGSAYYFGADLSVSPDGKILFVTSEQAYETPNVTFDVYTERLYPTSNVDSLQYINDTNSKERISQTTFDGKTTNWYSTLTVSNGSVFSFERLDTQYFFAQEIKSPEILDGQIYGDNVYASNNCLFVGAPGVEADTDQTGGVYLFDYSSPTWKVSRSQDTLVDLDKIETVKLINTEDDTVADYIEVLDPLKGKIPGLADQEIKYKTAFDPAIYSIGLPGVNVDTNSNWLDEHLGELWWDISTLKYVWYEQGDVEFRRNSWMNVFPGCTIDVYEWVASENLPSQWSAIADTNEGLAKGISGQPKFPTNSIVSVKQVYNASTNAFTNVYYFWVRNKITVPLNSERNLSAYDVASLIADPRSQGMKYVGIVDSNSMILGNIQTSVIGTKINLNVDMDGIGNKNNKHTEWLLLQEGNSNSQPNTLLKKKVKDSLLGRDSLGNVVPDPALPNRLKYGIGIRPRQSLFKDRISALREMTEYANSILSKINIVDSTNLNYFNSQEDYPDASSGAYDVVVDDLVARDFSIVTRKIKPAQLVAELRYGRISNITITDPGFGYGNLYPIEYDINDNPTLWIGPTVTINGTGTDAELLTFVNQLGKVIRVEIKNAGKNYTQLPELIVRPFTALVLADEDVNNRWSYYTWSNVTKVYTRVRTQSWKTTDYWKYIDWKASNYDTSKDLSRTVESPYQLDLFQNVKKGSYVKVNNAGDGRYIILRKTDGTKGTWNNSYDLVYQENGTIEISDDIWSNVFGFDYNIGFDQLLYDQKPSVETENIINGLDVIFDNEYKVYSNKLFFKLVKYALAEQKFVDWAFKTSFISVINNAGELDQRPTYKLNNETYYQSYIEETKPFHTKVRNFQVNYTATDITQSIITDFDTPATFNTTTQKFSPTLLGNPLMNEYPWKSYYDNFKYHVDSIDIYDGGSGYEIPPVVVFSPAPGDTGSGAKAEAYIALGKVTEILITDPGSGYTATPIVTLLGGGSTTVKSAKFGVRMSNGKVRTNSITLKFDRVSGYNEIDSKDAQDRFVADGSTRTYQLTWAPKAEKAVTTVRVNGIKILGDAYSIETYTEKFNGYTKKYGRIVLTSVPTIHDVITVNYEKDLSLYHAVDRIRDFYQPESGMPGNTATLLMAGLEYPGVTVETLPLYNSLGFDSTPFGATNWDDYLPEVGLYETVGSINTSVFTLNYVPSTTTSLTVYVDNVRIYGYTTSNLTATTLQLVNGVVHGNESSNKVDIGISTTATSTISFRNIASDGSLPIVDIDLDTYISGGDGFATVFKDGIADDPSPDYDQIALDGDKLISEYNSYGPEENLPGRVSEVLGINVYTQPASGAGLSVLRTYPMNSSITRLDIGMMPPNTASVEVLYSGDIFTNYTIDYANQQIVLGQTISTGRISVKTMGMSGNNTLDRKTLVISTATGNTTFEFSCLYTEVKDYYVTVNGSKKTRTTDFLLRGKRSSGTAGRAEIKFNTALPTGAVVQMWLFGAEIKAFSEVKVQSIFALPNVGSWPLDNPPGEVEPYHAQVIVERDGRRLLPPDILYYTADGSNNSFSLNSHRTYVAGLPSNSVIEVYVNGVKKAFGADYLLIQNENRIEFVPNAVQAGDVVAICILIEHEYTIAQNRLYFAPGVSTTATSNVKIYSFTNHDSIAFRKERFAGEQGNYFQLERPVLGPEYIWVELNGKSLMRNVDFYLENATSLVLKDRYRLTPSDVLVVMSVDNVVDIDTTLGYRMFYDNLGRVHYKRLSAENSTRLAVTLTSTATTITVEDASVLTQPNLAKRRPGVILVNGERIQFYEVNGNLLSLLNRGTLGTSIKDSHAAGTTVIDQGAAQTMQVEDSERVYKTRTTATTTYSVAALGFDQSTSSHYQSEVYYQGKLLRRPGFILTTTNTTLGYDSWEITSGNTATNVANAGQYTISTTGTLTLSFIPVVGSELKVVKKYSKSMFESIQPFAMTTANNTVTNVHNVPVKLMHNNDTEQVRFMLRKPAQLPDKYYYGNK